MLIAFFADIHANRQAFDACLVQARGLGAARIVLLGDYVGYGADPEWTVTTVMDLVDNGAMAVRGNHDTAVGITGEDLNGSPGRHRVDARRARAFERSFSPACRSRWKMKTASMSMPRPAGPGAGTMWRAPWMPPAASAPRPPRPRFAVTSTGPPSIPCRQPAR